MDRHILNNMWCPINGDKSRGLKREHGRADPKRELIAVTVPATVIGEFCSIVVTGLLF